MWTLLQYLFCQITTWTVACEAFVPFCNIYFVKLQLGQWHVKHLYPFAMFILSNYNLDSGIRGMWTLLKYLFCQITTWTVASEACGPFCSIYFVKLQLGQWHVRHVDPFAVFILSNYNLDSGIRGMWTLLQYLFCQITTWTVACEAFVPFCNIYFVKLQLGQWHPRHVDPFAVFILSNYNLDSGM